MIRLNIYAHRGLFENKKIVENTISAFKKALLNNFNIELDIRVTKDNKIIVFHDSNIKRLTGIDSLVKEMTYEELSNVKLLNTTDKIPLLEDVLKLVNGRVTLLIEIKVNLSNNTLNELNKLLLDYNGKVLLQSFNPVIIRKMAYTSLKRYKMGILLTNEYKGFKKVLYDVFTYKYLIKQKYISFISSPKELVLKVKEVSLKEIFIWTIKTKEEFIKYKKYSNNLICNEKGIVRDK